MFIGGKKRLEAFLLLNFLTKSFSFSSSVNKWSWSSSSAEFTTSYKLQYIPSKQTIASKQIYQLVISLTTQGLPCCSTSYPSTFVLPSTYQNVFPSFWMFSLSFPAHLLLLFCFSIPSLTFLFLLKCNWMCCRKEHH